MEYDSMTAVLIEQAATDAYDMLVAGGGKRIVKFVQAGNQTFRVMVQVVDTERQTESEADDE